MGDRERQLDALLRAYRDAIPDPEVSSAFMPVLWERIESQRRSAFRLAKMFVTAAVAASLLLGVFLIAPSVQNSAVYSATYLEVLDADRSPDTLAYADVQPDVRAETSIR